MPDRIRVIVADDEPAAREQLVRALDSLAAEVLAVCGDGRELCEAAARLSPDALFVDIEMPELDGVAAIASMPLAQRPRVVFVTAHDELAVRAFDLEAVDYVLKPFRKERLARALERVQRAIPPGPAAASDRGERFVVLSPGEMTVIHESEIDYVEAERNYVRLHTAHLHPLVRETLRSIEQRLDNHEFVRTHRSFLARVSRIRRLEQRGSDWAAILDGGREVPVSRHYRDAVVARLAGG